MKHFAELDLSLFAIVIRWVDRCNPPDSRGIPVILCPLMIGDIKLEFSHDALDGVIRSNLA